MYPWWMRLAGFFWPPLGVKIYLAETIRDDYIAEREGIAKMQRQQHEFDKAEAWRQFNKLLICSQFIEEEPDEKA